MRVLLLILLSASTLFAFPLYSSSSSTTNPNPNPALAFLNNLFTNSNNSNKKKTITNDYDEPLAANLKLLYKAADGSSSRSRSSEDNSKEEVLAALQSCETLMRQKVKAEGSGVSSQILDSLNGQWRLVCTTGTQDAQKKGFGGDKGLSYFPIKAVQEFDPTATPMKIANGIYLGDFALLKFFGDFDFNLKSRKLEFDFDQISVLGLTFNIGKTTAAEIGKSTGLGSSNNIQLVEKKKRPFFNWILADEKIALARGGGGGLAMWKRVVE